MTYTITPPSDDLASLLSSSSSPSLSGGGIMILATAAVATATAGIVSVGTSNNKSGGYAVSQCGDGGSGRSSNSKDTFVMIVSASLFTMTASWIVRDLRRYSRRTGSSTRNTNESGGDNDRSSLVKTVQQKQLGSTGNNITNGSNSTALTDYDIEELANSSHVSARGYRVANAILHSSIDTVPMMSYFQKFFEARTNPCDIIDNRTGYILLCVAENKLVTDMLAERMNQAGTAELAFSEIQTYHYNAMTGIPMAKDAFSYFLTKRFLYPERATIPIEEALDCIPAKYVAIGAGAASILNNVFYMLGDKNNNDCCLIPTPYYAAFETDMNLLAGVVPFPIVPTTNPTHGPTIRELDVAYFQAKSAGYNPRFLLLTNPHNPLGTIYPVESIRSMIQWCRSKKMNRDNNHNDSDNGSDNNTAMHVIVDEIYALSTHKPNGQHSFQSIIKILDNDLGNDVHMIWAMSKDFGSSGLRCGILYSRNEMLHRGLNSLHMFCSVSGPFQYMISEVLTDDAFIDTFLERARHRTLHNYNICINKLQEMVIPFVPAEAGIFVYIDLSSLLPQRTFQYERQLSDLLFECRLVLTPGESQRDPTPGMYRICYAWVSPDVLEIAMERLSRLVAKIRRMDWDDLFHNVDISNRTIASILDV